MGLYHSQNQTIQMVSSDYQTFGQTLLHSIKEVYQNQDIIVPKIKIVEPASVEKGAKIKMTTVCSKTKKMDAEYTRDQVYSRSTKN